MRRQKQTRDRSSGRALLRVAQLTLLANDVPLLIRSALGAVLIQLDV